jgi:hypothetical protein
MTSRVEPPVKINSNGNHLRGGDRGHPVPVSPEFGSGPTAVLVRLDSVKAEQVSWLWPGRIPRGKLVIIEGHPGVGKSHLALELAACISTGRSLPGSGPMEPSQVVILTAEDGLGDTVRPRLEAAEGDASRVHAVTGIRSGLDQRFPEFPTHCPQLLREVKSLGAKLVIIDPLSAYLGTDINSFRDQDVRRALRPLSDLGQATGAAVVVVRHLTKATMGSAITAGGGSIGIIGQARTALLVAKDPEDQERVILAVSKNNLSAIPASLAYSIESGEGGSRIRWVGESRHSADDLIVAGRDDDEKSATHEAGDLLRQWLADGPQPKIDIAVQAKKAGISSRTLERAKTALGVVHVREGFGPGSRIIWRLSAYR